MKDLLSQKPDASIQKNAVVVQVQNTVIEKGKSPMLHLLDVAAKMTTKGDPGESVDIKDILTKDGDK